MATRVSVIAILLSIVSLGISFTAHSRAERAAAAQVQEREREFVQWLAPHLQQIYEDFDTEGVKKDPQSVEEALDPLFKMINLVGEYVE